MSPLGQKLIARIRADGPMNVGEYMAACLSDPVYGYYMRREPFGRYGDFVTAPEVSQMFGEMIGVWAIVTWESMGSPDRFVLAELGPGRGTLMADLLRIASVKADFLQAADVHLVETSPRLREIQAATLGQRATSVHWHDRIADLPQGPAIIIANEFFDALPIRQFHWSGEAWSERMIGLDSSGQLAFGLRPVAQRPPPEHMPAGTIIEISPLGTAIITEIGERLARDGGALLTIDYGSALPRHGNTFQAVRQHQYADPLENAGEADLTAHVDFSALARAAEAGGASAKPIITQGSFLEAMGIGRRVETLTAGRDEATREKISSAQERLTGSKAMGELFKVLAISQPGLVLPVFDGT